VFHDEVTITGFLADDFDQFGALVERIGIGLHKDGTVLITLGNGDVQVSHVTTMKLPLLFFHLKPLAIIPVQRVDFAKRFHGEIEDQFEMRYATGKRLPFQGSDETLAGGRWIHPCHVSIVRQFSPRRRRP
jgi:hypothetical protein